MREPVVEPGAQLLPGTCMVCGGNEGRMLDTTVDVRGIGRFYVCLKTCMPLAAHAAGYATPDDVQVLREQIGEVEGHRDALLAELETEKAKPQQLLTLADLNAWADERGKKARAKQPAGDAA